MKKHHARHHADTPTGPDPDLDCPRREMTAEEWAQTQMPTDPTALYARLRARFLRPGEELHVRVAGDEFGDATTVKIAGRAETSVTRDALPAEAPSESRRRAPGANPGRAAS